MIHIRKLQSFSTIYYLHFFKYKISLQQDNKLTKREGCASLTVILVLLLYYIVTVILASVTVIL